MTNPFLHPHKGRLLIKGGRVIDPRHNVDQVADVLIQDDRIQSVGPHLNVPHDTVVIDAGRKVVAPGLIDLHVH
jgi:dihydroorotase